MNRLEKIRQGLKSKNQDDWATFDDIEWLMEQASKLKQIRDVLYAEDTNVVDCYRKIIEIFEGKKVVHRSRKQ